MKRKLKKNEEYIKENVKREKKEKKMYETEKLRKYGNIMIKWGRM